MRRGSRPTACFICPNVRTLATNLREPASSLCDTGFQVSIPTLPHPTAPHCHCFCCYNAFQDAQAVVSWRMTFFAKSTVQHHLHGSEHMPSRSTPHHPPHLTHHRLTTAAALACPRSMSTRMAVWTPLLARMYCRCTSVNGVNSVESVIVNSVENDDYNAASGRAPSFYAGLGACASAHTMALYPST
eukprot:68000-Chlamydomonas_euryale.AAC.7